MPSSECGAPNPKKKRWCRNQKGEKKRKRSEKKKEKSVGVVGGVRRRKGGVCVCVRDIGVGEEGGGKKRNEKRRERKIGIGVGGCCCFGVRGRGGGR